MDDSLYIRYAVYKMSVLSLSMRDGKSADSADRRAPHTSGGFVNVLCWGNKNARRGTLESVEIVSLNRRHAFIDRTFSNARACMRDI